MIMAKESERFIRKKMEEANGLRFIYTTYTTAEGIKCGGAWWDQLEEAVVEDAALTLGAKVGANTSESNYWDKVQHYRKSVINQLGESSRWILMRFQQESDLDGYLAYIGNIIRRPDIPRNVALPKDLQVALGSTVVGPITELSR